MVYILFLPIESNFLRAETADWHDKHVVFLLVSVLDSGKNHFYIQYPKRHLRLVVIVLFNQLLYLEGMLCPFFNGIST